jgi:FMN hydrolase / 5-amino-6-(5-phospho-D-ribitylamino)uracil phosphatase
MSQKVISRNQQQVTSVSPAPQNGPLLQSSVVRGVSLDLDDTLWPIGPTIERAEQALHRWLCDHSPMTAALYSSPHALHDLRQQVATQRQDLKHDLGGIRREAIRLAMYRAGEDPLRADEAFEVFFAERQRVNLYDDSLPTLEWLAARYPLVALSNGNADVERIGIGRFFKASISAKALGVGKPHERCFEAAAQALGLQPHEVLHVGDDVSMDVIGAMAAGMQAVWLNRNDAMWPHDNIAPHLEINDLLQLCDALGGPGAVAG